MKLAEFRLYLSSEAYNWLLRIAMPFWWRVSYQRFQQWLKLATMPHQEIESLAIQHNVRLLATLTLIILPLHIFTALALFAAYGLMAQTGKLTLVTTVATLIIYVLSRTRYGEHAINLFVLEMTLLAIVLLYINADAYSAVTAILPIYIASLFRPIKRLIVTTVVTILSVFILSQILPGDWEQIYGVLILLIVISAVIIVRSRVQWELEEQIRQRNEQLTESSTRFRAAINAGRTLFALLQTVVDPDGRLSDFLIVDANTRLAVYLDQSYTLLIGQPVVNVLPSALLEHLLPQFHKLVYKQLPILYGEVSVEHIWWEYQLVSVGESIALSLDDITARKDAEVRQLELQREREQARILSKFITDVSHDIMTPLSIINSKAYLAGLSQDSDKRDKHLAEIKTQVFRLRDMVDQMLSQSKLYHLKPEDLDLQIIDLNDLLEHLVTEFRQNERYSQRQLMFQPSQALGTHPVDKIRLELAVSNLIENALKYTPDTGMITVCCQEIDQGIAIDVSDEGSGIPHHALTDIFAPFYRLETHRPQTAGSGLGLSISKTITELHGGIITAKNRPTGGMLFRIYLPFLGGETDSNSSDT